MSEVLYATGNDQKFLQARTVCDTFGIKLRQQALDIAEIQSDTGEPVARDKAAKAFTVLKQRLVVSDDTWSIPGLKGFPGPYMKYINDWFDVEDWLNLTRTLSDRRVLLTQIVVYCDDEGQRTFSCTTEGIILTESRGKSRYPHSALVSFDDGKHTNAEYHERGESAIAYLPNAWHDFAEWYGKHHAQS